MEKIHYYFLQIWFLFDRIRKRICLTSGCGGHCMNLFSQTKNSNDKKPLAFRMRPKNFDELYGQEHIAGEGKLLRRMIESDRLQSMILYGPPGSGKTSLAKVIAENTSSEFIKINAVTSGVQELRDIISKGKDNLQLHQQKTILFIDEIHRFNKSQQDALLPSVEEGFIILAGATTENPYFEVNSPLLSRSRIFKLEPLSAEDIKKIVLQALKDEERGLGNLDVIINDQDLNFLAEAAKGDARSALNALEIAVLSTSSSENGEIILDSDILSECLQEKQKQYDKTGDNHYDVVSAFIKSIRGSDPDAALFWLARMIEAGEDPMFIARRIIVHAAEDVGMADPDALNIAVSAARALEYVGMPEARLPLAEAVLYLATAPKSNSTITSIDKAIKFIKENDTGEVPDHIKDTHYSGAKKLGHGEGYKYPHNYSDNFVRQNYMPEKHTDVNFYNPDGQGREKKVKKYLEYLRENEGESFDGKK